jgi:hypothetical protein
LKDYRPAAAVDAISRSHVHFHCESNSKRNLLLLSTLLLLAAPHFNKVNRQQQTPLPFTIDAADCSATRVYLPQEKKKCLLYDYVWMK